MNRSEAEFQMALKLAPLFGEKVSTLIQSDGVIYEDASDTFSGGLWMLSRAFCEHFQFDDDAPEPEKES